MDESTVRQKARSALESGNLPNRPADRMWGGPGSGGDCAVCGQRVTREEMSFDLEFSGDGAPRGSVNHELHMRCFAAWEFERDNITAEPGALSAGEPSVTDGAGVMGSPSDPAVERSGLPSAQNHGTIGERERDSNSKRGPV
ncbi:MAG: hypothetical protein JWN85_2322 [Gammaproteobacteria bacterium]|nr:hypothetical protein [Gammaproteobacteria bacterium]